MSDADKQVVPYLKIRAKEYHIDPKLAHELAAIVIEWGVFENAISMDLEQLRQYAPLYSSFPIPYQVHSARN